MANYMFILKPRMGDIIIKFISESNTIKPRRGDMLIENIDK